MENNHEVSLRTMFCSTFMLSMLTFGGGFVIVPLMKKRLSMSCTGLRKRK